MLNKILLAQIYFNSGTNQVQQEEIWCELRLMKCYRLVFQPLNRVSKLQIGFIKRLVKVTLNILVVDTFIRVFMLSLNKPTFFCVDVPRKCT